MQDVAVDPGTRDLGPPAIEVHPPAPAANQGQMLLVKDEAGVLTWHFADTSRAFGDGGQRTYRIDPRVAATARGPGTRGFASAIGTKLLNVVVFPLIEPTIGEVSDYFAGRWEAQKRPYRLRWSTPDDFADAGGARTCRRPTSPTRASCPEKGKRTLLLVHGTFSRSYSGFGALPKETFAALHSAVRRAGDRARPLHALAYAEAETSTGC